MKNILSFEDFLNESYLTESSVEYDGGKNTSFLYKSHETLIAGKWEALPVTIKAFGMSIARENTGAKALVCIQETRSRDVYDWKFVRILSGKNKGICYIFDTKTNKTQALGDKKESIDFKTKTLGVTTIEIDKISDSNIKSIFDELVEYTAKM